MRPQCTCKQIVSKTSVRTEMDPQCPLHAPPSHITLKFKLSDKDDKIHAIDCDLDEDCTCS